MPNVRALKLVWLTVNRGCNFRCLWCYASASEYNTADEMPLSAALNYLRIVSDAGIKKVFLIGGEPTLWSSLFEFNDALRATEVSSVIVTNAQRFSDDRFWNNYLEHPNTHIGASFKAFSPESLLANAKATTFPSVTKGLERVFAHQPNSIASFVYSRPYVSHFLDMVKYAVRCGAHGVAVNFCSPAVHRDFVDATYVVDIDEMVREITACYEEAHAITHGRLVFVMKHPLCIWPKTLIETLKCRGQIQTTCHLQHQTGGIIETDGSLCLCNSLFDFPVGKYGRDFDSAESLLSLFSSQHVTECFSQLRTYPSLKCSDCEVFSDCAGGCPLLWTAHSPQEVIRGW